MIKCISCPFKYLDIRDNQKCLIDKEVVNAYGCHRILSEEIKDRKIDIDIADIYRETQDYKDSIEHSNRGISNGEI